MTRLPLGIVADDITGSGDIGGLLAGHGYAVRVISAEADWEQVTRQLARARTDVFIIDTDSRLIGPEEAADRVRRAGRALQAVGCRTFWKKTCSVFRGNVGAEFDALMDGLGQDFAVAVAAFPKNGRTTIHGEHFVRGVPLPQTEFAHDPIHPRTDANLVRDLGQQTPHRVEPLPLEVVRSGVGAIQAELERLRSAGVRYVLADTETQDDLKTLAQALSDAVVQLGSSALAEELPATWPPVEPFDALGNAPLPQPRRVMIMAGSVMPQTRAQLAAYRDSGGQEFVLDTELALTDSEEAVRELVQAAGEVLQADQPALVRTPNTPKEVAAVRARGAELGLDGTQVSRILSTVLAQAASESARSAQASRLVALGGDTSAALTRALGVRHSLVLQELEPGLPVTFAPEQRLLLVLKSGSFGTPQFLNRALKVLGEPS